MKIGILSDTHGNLQKTAQAVALFRQHRVGAVFHCGDVGNDGVLSELATLAIPIYVVLGNVDRFSNEWKFFPQNLGVLIYPHFGEVHFAGQRMALLHGEDQSRFDETVNSGNFDYVFSGHTHAVHDYRVGHTRCINPGAVGKGNPGTGAVLDLTSEQREVFELGV